MKVFQKGSVFDLERHLSREMAEYISTLDFDPERTEDMVPGLVERYRIIAPELDIPEEMQPCRQLERTVDDDGRLSRMPFPQRYKVVDIDYEVAIRGDANLLDFTPQSYAFMFSSGCPERRGGNVVFTYELPLGGEATQVTSRLLRDVKMLKDNIAGLQDWTRGWNASLESRIQSNLLKRANELRQRKTMVQGLKVKIQP